MSVRVPDVYDLIALPPPRSTVPVPRYTLIDKPRLGRYFLCERVPCGGDDECYIATPGGFDSYEPYVFLRRFPVERLDDPMRERLKRIASVHRRGFEQVYELGRDAGHAFVATELIAGVRLDQFDARLVAHGQRLPWKIALALLFDATDRLGLLRAAGALHGGVTAARLRLADTGKLYLCNGVPATDAGWTQALFAVVRPILRLAATAPERELLDGVLDDADSAEALAIASDALVLRHPELDPILPALFRALLDDTPPVRERARAMLAEHVNMTTARRLWALVLGHT